MIVEIVDSDLIVKHLRETINDKKHWVAVAISLRGRLMTATLALLVTVRGAGDLCRCGNANWWDVRTNHRASVFFLTIPKECLSTPDLKRWMAEVPIKTYGDGDDDIQDLITVSASAEERERIFRFSWKGWRGAERLSEKANKGDANDEGNKGP